MKALDADFQDMNLLMQNVAVFMPLCNQKRYITSEPLKLPVQTLDTVWVTKRYQNTKIKLEMESMDPKLSKSGLRMFLRCLVRKLCSEVVT